MAGRQPAPFLHRGDERAVLLRRHLAAHRGRRRDGYGPAGRGPAHHASLRRVHEEGPHSRAPLLISAGTYQRPLSPSCRIASATNAAWPWCAGRGYHAIAMSLTVMSCCTYLTDAAEVAWRPVDYDAHDFVMAVKGRSINGYAYVPCGGTIHRIED